MSPRSLCQGRCGYRFPRRYIRRRFEDMRALLTSRFCERSLSWVLGEQESGKRTFSFFKGVGGAEAYARGIASQSAEVEYVRKKRGRFERPRRWDRSVPASKGVVAIAGSEDSEDPDISDHRAFVIRTVETSPSVGAAHRLRVADSYGRSKGLRAVQPIHDIDGCLIGRNILLAILVALRVIEVRVDSPERTIIDTSIVVISRLRAVQPIHYINAGLLVAVFGTLRYTRISIIAFGSIRPDAI